MATVSGNCDLLRVHRASGAAHHGILAAGSLVMPCALGRAGIRRRKREGDGASPEGVFPLRKLYFRRDRLPRPRSALETAAIFPDLGWCDDPASLAYNSAVRLPTAARHERMWRDDHLYDLVIVIGFNDDPAPLRPFGSAIFLHLARPGFAPTEGCVALRRHDLRRLLPRIGPDTKIAIG
ncbi:L,D-transpeptidase family protein [Microbaculum marinum]|uniref:L,D-transpeptidase family protein n=1 Tax=Microbaculum marinum TaxID=1764581 RepID=A0AAW9RZR8_9HYPH